MSASVLVYGATGRTGTQVCAALRARGLSVLAVGRDAAKLDALVRALGGDCEVAVARLQDEGILRSLLERSRMAVNCAGPFSRCGVPLQDAALEVGRHCLDVSGEPHVVRGTLARDDEARRRNVLLVSGVGFDVVPTDALAVLLAARVGAQVQSVRVAYSQLDATATNGLGLTMVQGLLEGGLAFEEGAFKHEELGRDRWRAPFPSPLGTVLCSSAPWGDLASLPRSTGARMVRAYLPRPPASAAMARSALRALRCALSPRAFEALCAQLAGALAKRLPLATDSLSAVIEVSGTDGRATGWVTAVPGTAAQAAATCAGFALAPSFSVFGAHTPATAFGALPLLSELSRWGLRWGIYNGPD